MTNVKATFYGPLFVSIFFSFCPGPASAADDISIVPVYSLLLGNNGPSIRLVKDINPGVNSSEAEELMAFNDVLYLSATDGVHGNEVWTSDGTTAGTAMLKDINVGSGDSDSYTTTFTVGWNREFTAMGSSLYFTATDGNHPVHLWKTNGTTAGTTQVHNVTPGGLTVLNNALYFSGSEGTDFELWKSDGTESGTTELKNISDSSSSYPGDESGFTLFNNELYFSVSNATAESCHLWKTDGTTGGTMAIKPGTELEPSGKFAVCNNTLYFAAYDNTHGYEIWKSNGSSGGTVMLPEKDFSATPQSFTEYNGALYFTADDGISGSELWKLNCSTDALSLVKDINPDASGSSPQRMMVFNDRLYFRATHVNSGKELWKSDGTASGTVMVKDINPGSGDSSPQGFTAYNGKLYISAYDGAHGDELWRSDGTEAGTIIVKDINPGVDSSDPYDFTVINNTLFLTADDGAKGWELWKLQE